jgi:hypothetical protein
VRGGVRQGVGSCWGCGGPCCRRQQQGQGEGGGGGALGLDAQQGSKAGPRVRRLGCQPGISRTPLALLAWMPGSDAAYVHGGGGGGPSLGLKNI